MVNIIVAISENNAIGKEGKLLFKLKHDMENFKKTTTNQVVIMGRRTFESIGKPLPDRVNVVLTRQPLQCDVIVYDDLKKAVKEMQEAYPGKEIFIIGGGQVYKEALEKGLAGRLYMTKVKKVVEEADTFFPPIDYRKDWWITEVERFFENGVEYFIYKADKR